MDTIKCPECRKEISDTSDRCPFCGYIINDCTEKTPKWKKIALIIIISLIALLVFIIAVNKIAYNSKVNSYKNIVDEFVDDWYTLQKYENAEKKDNLSIDIYYKSLNSNLHKLSDGYTEIIGMEEVLVYMQTKIKAEMIFPVISYNNSTTGLSYDYNEELLNFIKYNGYSVSDIKLINEGGKLYCTGIFKNEKDHPLSGYLEATAYFFDKDGNVITETTYGLMGMGAEPLASGDTKIFKIEAYTYDTDKIVSCDVSIHY